MLFWCRVLRLEGYTLGSRRLAKKTLNRRLKSSTNVQPGEFFLSRLDWLNPATALVAGIPDERCE